MAPKPAEKQSTEAKLQALGAQPSGREQREEQTLKKAEEAFKAAVEKTKKQTDESEGKEETVVETVPHKPKAEKPRETKAPAPKPKPDPVASMQAKVDELERKLAEKAKPEPKPEPKVDPLESVKASLAEEFGEDEANSLVGAMGPVLKALMERTEKLENLLNEASRRGKEQFSKSNYARLSEKYAPLKNKAAWEIVKAQAEAIAQNEPTKFETPEEIYDHVAETLYGAVEAESEPEAEEAEESEDAEEVERIKASTVSDPGRAKRERSLSNDEKAKAIFDHLFKNPEDLAGAKKVARQLRVN